ncbi:MAG: hypothetical protein ACKVOP_05110 [Sphingomonadaceae bacterium]
MKLLVGTAATALAGCAQLFPTRYRFRLTVEVETPSGLLAGFSVFEAWANHHTGILFDERSRDWGVKGQAVAVDLPNGRVLFALLKTANPMRNDLAQVSMAALDPAFANDIVDSAGRISARRAIRPSATLAVSDYPLLVTFRDLQDPTSVEQVNPADLASTFGLGVELVRVTVGVTDDPVTTEIEQRLEWLARQRGSLVKWAQGDKSLDRPIGMTITEMDFSSEIVR